MTKAVCFTQSLDGLVHCAWGDFAWKEPRSTRHQPTAFAELMASKFTGLEGHELDLTLEHASKPGCAVAIVMHPRTPALALLINTRENEGAPPHPEKWTWWKLRQGHEGSMS